VKAMFVAGYQLRPLSYGAYIVAAPLQAAQLVITSTDEVNVFSFVCVFRSRITKSCGRILTTFLEK